MYYTVEKSVLGGEIRITPSKSHTMRAILLASLAGGVSRVRSPLPSPDTEAMCAACGAFGAVLEEKEGDLSITGVGGRPRVPRQVIDVGNSGQVLRFGAAVAALLPEYSVFTGDESVRSLRPMDPLLKALEQLGAFAVSSKNDGYAPIIIRGPARPGAVVMDGLDSQPVSAVLMLAAFLPGLTSVAVNNPGEKPWIDLTLHWLDRLGASCLREGYTSYRVQGRAPEEGAYAPLDCSVPGDWSSAAFPLAAALLTNSSLTLRNLDPDDPQGDKELLALLERMGARFTLDRRAGSVLVRAPEGGGKLRGLEADVNGVIDALPILAVLGCFASSPTRLSGAAAARGKESDRLAAITEELSKMGARIEEYPDGLRIYPSVLRGARVDSHGDHRIAMSLAVAALACGNVRIENTACVAKSFPGFAAALRSLGASIEEGS
ncbi:MAG: 3-phosphoshikimate 1-carboxyvinyltransferase [Deltaproteobacteria bacterium]|jgi:3-phosphoshikimate 1-carboxyvinyltransferase|nr:3-phosphoshikimate 1-carboxyvinyltransferase [Deltaproteobacteria bacterium]